MSIAGSGDAPRVTVRPGRQDDLAELARVMAANDEPVGWPDLPEIGYPYLDHVLRHKRLRVAESEGAVVGIGATADVGSHDVRMITDLFVDPDRHERGAGRALLDAILGDATGRLTFSSADERALGLYIRAGLRPWWPLLYLAIAPGGLGGHDPGIAIRDADPAETGRHSAAWTGVDRTIDHVFYAGLPEAAGFAVLDGGEVAAVGWAHREQDPAEGRWLSGALIAPDADAVRATFAILRAAGGGQRLGAAVPGPHPAVAKLLEAGVHIEGRDTFCATDPDLIDPARLLPHPGFL